MNDLSPIPPIGHNNPPGPFLPEPLQAQLADFIDAAGVWADLKTLDSQEQADKASDFVAGATKLEKALDAERTAQKRPHDDAAKAVQAFFAPELRKVELAKGAVKKLVADHLARVAAEERKAKAEAEARAAAEAAAAAKAKAEAEARNDIAGIVAAEEAEKEAAKAQKAAAKPVTARAESATGAGRTMSLRTTYSCEVENAGPALSYYRSHPEVIALIERLATAEVRGQKGEKVAPQGFRLVKTETAA